MVQISEKWLDELFTGSRSKTIAVVGDIMLDRYIWGAVSRISPEAPVPVVEVESESARLGGAANVAHNIHSLGGKGLLVGVAGNDASAEQLERLLQSEGCSTEGIIRDGTRPTTVKTRIIAHSQHVARVDRESRTEVAASLRNKMVAFLRDRIGEIDAIILEDYNKGVVDKNLIADVVALGKEYGKIVTADPKFNNFFEYKNVTVFKPNLKETEEALGVKLRSPAEVEQAGRGIVGRLGAQYVLLTQGEKGMSLFDGSGTIYHVPGRARHVADVSGAGDTVIATLSLALAGGASAQEAATLANYAGGVVCGEVGVVPITVNGLRTAVLRDLNHVPLSDGTA